MMAATPMSASPVAAPMDARMAAFKPDWAEARQRMLDWWAGRPTDRVVAHVLGHRADVPRRPLRTDVPGKYTDPATVFHNLDLRLEAAFWGAEAFPCHGVYLGPMFGCAYLGCEPIFEAGTTWYRSPYARWEDLRDLAFDRANPWWRLVRETTGRSAERARGRYLATQGNGLLAAFDLMAELIGHQATLEAMLERPDEVRALRDRITAWGFETYDALDARLRPFQEGSLDGMMVWAPGRVCSTQCDLCVMISPAMFRELVADELRAVFDRVEHGIYHLDGEDQIKHLDALLEIESLRLIQFVPVTKACDAVPRDPLKWTALYRRILEAGKKVLIYCPPERIEPLLRQIPRQGVFLHVVGCREERVARDVIATLERIGV